VASCHQEIEFATTRAHLAHALIGVFSEDPSAQRVTHNDCKINNVLFHEASGKAACVIDLDTVMPGTALYDFGDLVRTVCGTAKEDERDLDRMTFSMDNFRAVLNGYLQPLRTILTPAERRRFALAGKVITYEIGLRFLADHLNGDLYFSVSREQHNLDRARTQFKLVSEMERRWDEIRHAAEEETGEVQLG
jgi:Ser/Thr protein kinase RdoA (MazF antagonist)